MKAQALSFIGFFGVSSWCLGAEFTHEFLPNLPGSSYTSYALLGEEGQLMGTTNFGTGNRTFMLGGGELRYFSYPGSSVTDPVAMREQECFIGKHGSTDEGFVYDHGVYSELRTTSTNESITPLAMSQNGNIGGNIEGKLLYARIGGAEFFPYFSPGYTAGSLYGINNKGVSFGYMEDGHSSSQAFVWSPSMGVNLIPFDTRYGDLNNKNEFVGFEEYFNGLHAVVMRNGVTQYLGSGNAKFINDDSSILIQDNNQGFLWRHGVRTNVRELIDPTLDFDRIGFIDMNNRGQILAGLTKYTGPTSATYQTVLFTPVPEPGTWLTLGLAGICALRRRKLLASK